MNEFLKKTKNDLSKIDQKKVIHIVMGNESCDLDSCISSIVYAYLLNISKCESEDCIVIPILNTSRSLLKLKSEVLYWIQRVLNLTGDSLICKDDLDLTKLRKSKDQQILITLVDHNFNEELEKLGKLIEIIDHHQLSVNRSNDVRTEIETTVGSCCTLVARRYLNFCKENQLKIDEQISLFLYGPIILDSICFSEEARRFNELDIEMAKQLESLLVDYYAHSRDEVFQQLLDAKNSISSLTFKEILLKDMKLVNAMGDNLKVITSSISGRLVGDLIRTNEQQAINDLKEFSIEHNYSLILIMGIQMNPNSIQRDLAIYSTNDHLLDKVSQTLLNHNNKELKLDIVESKNNLIVFIQNNVQASRKVVLPVLDALFGSEQFIADYNSGVFNSSISSLQTTDKLQANDSTNLLKSSSNTYHSETNGCTNEGKLSSSDQVTIVRSDSLTSSTKQSSNSMDNNRAPESINYYESYFLDSYVGEFNGEVANDKLDQQQIDEINWCDEEKIENALEFGFDSFGPESILFQTTNSDNSLTNQAKKLQTIKETNDETSAKRVKKSSTESADYLNQQLNQINQSEDYDNLISLSVAEPQLKQKLDKCFDVNKIKNGYDISKSILAFDQSLSDEENDEPNYVSSDQQQLSQQPNKSTDSQVEVFRLNDEEADENDDENFNSFIENTQFKSVSMDNSNSENNPTIIIDNEDDEQSNVISGKSGSDTTNSTNTITNLSIEDEQQTDNNDDDNNFKRQTTLTKSQRRRIQPKYKFEEMPSNSDDTNSVSSIGTDDLLGQIAKEQQIDQLKNVLLNELPNSMRPELTAQSAYSRTSTLKKKKIVADIKEDSHEENTHLDDPLRPNDHRVQNNINNEYCSLPTNQADQVPYPFNQQNKRIRANNLANEMSRVGLNDEMNYDQNWQESCPIGSEIKKIDMKVIEPYTRVLSHAGYYTNRSDTNGDSNCPAIILFSSCYLPDRTRKDYDYVMDNLFMYVLTTLHQLIANEYILIYFHNAANSTNSNANNMPTFQFLRRCYFLIDRKLRKNLKALYLVHPTFWLKSLVVLTKPFVNSKFSKKLKFVNNLSELNHLVPIDLRIIPNEIKKTDEIIERKRRKN